MLLGVVASRGQGNSFGNIGIAVGTTLGGSSLLPSGSPTCLSLVWRCLPWPR